MPQSFVQMSSTIAHIEKKKTLVPKLRFKAFRETWFEKSLGEIFKINAGGDIDETHVSPVQTEKYKYPIYANAEKNKGFYAYSDIYKVEAGTITIAGRGVNIGIAHARDHKFYPIVRLLVLIPLNNQDINFGEYAINRINLFPESTGVPQLTVPQVSGYKIAIPTLPEQQKIASFLSAIDEKIQQLTRKKKLLEQYKKGVMQQLFSGKLRFKDENGKTYPKWEKHRLIDIADRNIKWSFTGGPFGSNLKSEEYTDSGVRILQLQNIGDGVFNDEYKIYTSEEKADELESCNVYPGEILISKMGDPVARACRVPYGDRRYLMASDGIRFVPDPSRFSDDFIFQSINHPIFRNKALSLSTGSTRKRIGLTELKEILFSVPVLEEQQKIASYLSSLDTKIESVATQITQSQTFKKGLLQQMFV